ncbi:MAG: signal transduction histidine kinase [Microbacterium sp.]|jgi:two-component system sensor histidine kinase VanS|nr:signal transduction histidine kinase [Microbacterium sp.]
MRERPAGLSVRIKLTLSYAVFVVIVGIALFAVGFLVLRFLPEGNLYADSGLFTPARQNLADAFVKYAWLAVAGLAVIGLGGGWIVAGVMLRPLTRITDAARAVRDGDLDHRVNLPGRRDELTDLADTFDAMIVRIAETVQEQRRFAANASHELRTPHATMRTMLEVARADPEGVDIARLLARLDETNERAIRLTEALLVLSRASQGGAIARTVVAVDTVVADVCDEQATLAATASVRLTTIITSPAEALADETLVRQMLTNLVHNAIVYSGPVTSIDGHDPIREVHVVVTADEEGAVIDVVNTGAVLTRELVATLPEPFVRGAGRTRASDGGTGLGLAIAVAVVRAHEGSLDLWPREGGGLHARVRLPRVVAAQPRGTG